MQAKAQEAAGTGAQMRVLAGQLDLWLKVGLALATAIAFAPTVQKLVDGPWRTEQEGHGPLIIAASAWLAWQSRKQLRAAAFRPAYGCGWAVLLAGLAVLVVMRSQDVLLLEVASLLPIICGGVLLATGWNGLKILAFPISFLIFAVPPPGWIMDSLTVPLKMMVSDWATELLYRLGYPIAQNGVMIMIGPYQLMVKDACAGMNSIFALSAIGVFYIHEFVRQSRLRLVVLLLSILPIRRHHDRSPRARAAGCNRFWPVSVVKKRAMASPCAKGCAGRRFWRGHGRRADAARFCLGWPWAERRCDPAPPAAQV